MTIETELKSLVKMYAAFDSQTNCYNSKLDKNALLQLDANFAKLINRQLLLDGPENEKIAKRYRIMTLKFHPDHKLQFLPEVAWIEHNLSEGKNDGTCFKSLTFCYKKLTNPQEFKEKNVSNFSNIRNRDDVKKWLEHLKEDAATYSSRSLYDSLIALLEESGSFFDEMGKIKPVGLRMILTSIPLILVSYGAFIFVEELFGIYALYFVLLKGGQHLESKSSSELKFIGEALQKITAITATTTTTLLVRLLEMTFWASHQFYDVSLQIGSVILKPLLTAPTQTQQPPEEWTSENLCRDLMLASQNLSKGTQYQTPQLKVVSAPLELYLELNKQQFLQNWRAGSEKRLKIEAVLFNIRATDVMPASTEQKLLSIKKELDSLKENSIVYVNGSATAKAVDTADKILTLLQTTDTSSVKTITYDQTCPK